MSNYNTLKATIDANVKQNGSQAITGSIMNSVLNQMVTTLGAGYQYMGVAIPTTNPGTPDAKVCYVAATPGTYTNFKNSSNVALEVADGEVAILKYDTSWSKEVTGAATAAQVTQLSQKIDEFSQGKFYGYFSDADELPTGGTESGFAYVGTAAPFEVWNYDGSAWSDSGVTIDRIPLGNGEDIDSDADGKLQFANRSAAQGQMGYKILRKDATFAAQVTDANTIYEIRYPFDLGGNTISLPNNCIIRFNGGQLSNGTINVTSQVALSSNGIIVDRAINVDTDNNIVHLGLYHDCTIALSGADTHGWLFVNSNYQATIQYRGTTALIPTFENVIIKKTGNSSFTNISDHSEVARFKHCRIYSDEFETQAEALCTIAFSTDGETMQDAYDKIASGWYRVSVENCEFEGQGIWGNIRAINCKFVVTKNNLFNYEQLHLVGDSVIDGCFFTSSFTMATVDNSLQDVIDCFTSRHVTISNCIFENMFCAAIVSYKQNPLETAYYIKGGGVTLENNVFRHCVGQAFLFYSDSGKYTNNAYSLHNDIQARIINNFFCDVRSAYARSSIVTNVGDVITLSTCSANVIIDGNRFEFAKRSCAIRVLNYCQHIIISNNIFYKEEGSTIGASFIVTFEVTSGTYSNAKDIIVEGNHASTDVVLTQSTESLASLSYLCVRNNCFERILNASSQGTELEKKFDIEFSGNSHLYNNAYHLDIARNPSDTYFLREKIRYRGASFFDIDGNKIVTWDGFAWVDQAGNSVTYS